MAPPPPEELDDFGDFSDGFDSDDNYESGYSEPPQFDGNLQRAVEDRIVGAISAGQPSALQQLLDEGNDVNTPLQSGWTMLMYAASESQPDIVRYLLNNGADVNKHFDLLTPLMCACSSTSIHEISNVACVKFLLEKGAIVNAIDIYGQTSLIRAVDRGRKIVTAMLIPFANLETRDSYGRTALFYAVQNDYSDILQLLLDAGASVNIMDKHRCSIKDLAISKGHQPTLDILKDLVQETTVDIKQSEYLSCRVVENWKEMFPNIIPCDKPAYWNSIPVLLHGMYCENLAKLFKEKNIGLSRFLTLTEKELTDLNEIMPYQRKRLLSGLNSFHMRPWKIETIVGIGAKNDFKFETSIEYFASHLKHMTVIDATFQYIYNAIKFKNYDGNFENCEINYMVEFNRFREQLTKFHNMALEINNKNAPLADLIKPEIPKNIIMRNKKKITFMFISVFCIATAIKLRST